MWICATQILSVALADTYISALMNTSHLLSEGMWLTSTGGGGGQNECRERIHGTEKVSRKVGVFNLRIAVKQRSQTLFIQSDWIQSKLFN